jgi:hypothetical protein
MQLAERVGFESEVCRAWNRALLRPMETHCRSECSYTAHVMVRWCDAALRRSSALPVTREPLRQSVVATQSRPNQHGSFA